jgi:hypothetical protein
MTPRLQEPAIRQRKRRSGGGAAMTFEEMLDQAIALLQRRGRVSYRALKRQFQLDDDYLEDLKTEIIKAQRLAVDEDGEVLVWVRDPAIAPPPTPRSSRVRAASRLASTAPRRWWLPLIGLPILAVIGVMILVQTQRSQPPPSMPATAAKASSPLTRTVIERTPGMIVYAYETAQGETVKEYENAPGTVVERRIYRPAPAACAYVQSLGLKTEGYWREESHPLFSCSSPYKEVGIVADPDGLGLKNNLAYYVSGDAEQMHEMRLVLNVNQRREAKQAHQELLRTAQVLTQQALNRPLPKAVERALVAGKPWQGAIKDATIEIIRFNGPTGEGYDLKFLVRPTGQTRQ